MFYTTYEFAFSIFQDRAFGVANIQNSVWSFILREKAMATHSCTLAWKIPWTEGPGRLRSMGSLSQTGLKDFTFTFHFHALEKAMATHCSVLAWRIPGMGESDTTEAT